MDINSRLASLLESIRLTPRSTYNAISPPKEPLAISPKARRGYIPRLKYQALDAGLSDPYLPHDIDGVSPQEQVQLQADLQICRWKALSSSLSDNFVREGAGDSHAHTALSPALASRFVRASSPGASSSLPRQTNNSKKTAPLPRDHGFSFGDTPQNDIGKDGRSARRFEEKSPGFSNPFPPAPPGVGQILTDDLIKDLPRLMKPRGAICHAAILQCTNCKSWACRHGDEIGSLCAR